jgi:hypothetical protein
LDELGLFTVALGLSEPWRVTRTEFDPERPQLDLYLEVYAKPHLFASHGLVRDHSSESWRHAA